MDNNKQENDKWDQLFAGAQGRPPPSPRVATRMASSPSQHPPPHQATSLDPGTVFEVLEQLRRHNERVGASSLLNASTPSGDQTGSARSRTASPLHCTRLDGGSGSKRKQEAMSSGEEDNRHARPSKGRADSRSRDRSSRGRRRSSERDPSHSQGPSREWTSGRNRDHESSSASSYRSHALPRDKDLDRPGGPPRKAGGGFGLGNLALPPFAARNTWNIQRGAHENAAAIAVVRQHAYSTVVEDPLLSDLSARSAVPQVLGVGALVTGFSRTGSELGDFFDRVAQASGLYFSQRAGWSISACTLPLDVNGLGAPDTVAVFRELSRPVITSFPLSVKHEARCKTHDVTAGHRILHPGSPRQLTVKLLSRSLWDRLHADLKPVAALAVRCYAKSDTEVDLISQFLTRFFEPRGGRSCFILPHSLLHSKAPPEIVFILFVEDTSTRDAVRRSFLSSVELEHPGVINMTDLRFHMAPHMGIFFNLPFDPRLSAQPGEAGRLAVTPHCLPGGSRLTVITTDLSPSPHPQRLAQLLFSLSNGPEIIGNILFLHRAEVGKAYVITWKARGFTKIPSLHHWEGNFHVSDAEQSSESHRVRLLAGLLGACPEGWRSEAFPPLPLPRTSAAPVAGTLSAAPLPPSPPSPPPPVVAGAPCSAPGPPGALPSCGASWHPDAQLALELKVESLVTDLQVVQADLEFCENNLTGVSAAQAFDRESYKGLETRLEALATHVQELATTILTFQLERAPLKMVSVLRKDHNAFSRQTHARLETVETRLRHLGAVRSPSGADRGSFVSPSSLEGANLSSGILELSLDGGYNNEHSTFDDHSFIIQDPVSPPRSTAPARAAHVPDLLSPKLVPMEEFDFSHGPVLVGGSLHWRFSAIWSSGLVAVSLVVNLDLCVELPPTPSLEQPSLPGVEHKATDEELQQYDPVVIPHGCSVEFFREYKLLMQGSGARQVVPSQLSGWYRGHPSKLAREDLLGPLDPEAEIGTLMAPLHPCFLDSALVAVLQYGHVKLNSVLETRHHANCWHPESTVIWSAGNTDMMTITPCAPGPAMLALMLCTSSSFSPTDLAFEAAMRATEVMAHWEVPVLPWGNLNNSQRKNCGVLVGVLSLVLDEPTKNIFQYPSKCSEKQCREVAESVKKTFLASPKDMNEIVAYITSPSTCSALPASSIWADEALLGSLPLRRFVTSENDEIDFCFPVWVADTDNSKSKSVPGGSASLLWPGVRGSPLGSSISIACLVSMISVQRRVLLVSAKPSTRSPTNPGRRATAGRIPKMLLDYETMGFLLALAARECSALLWSSTPPGDGEYTPDPFVAPPPTQVNTLTQDHA